MKNGSLIKLFLYSITILIFLYVTIFGLPLIATMHDHNGMPTGNCPFTIGKTTLCEMNIIEHITSWQAMFIALPFIKNILFILLIFILTFVISRFLYDKSTISLSKKLILRIKTLPLSFSLILLGTIINPRAP